jgi:hypothetical protein
MDPITLTVITVALSAIGKSFSSLIAQGKSFSKILEFLNTDIGELLSSRMTKRAVKLKFQTKDGRIIEIEGDLGNTEEVGKLIAALNEINAAPVDASEKVNELEKDK